VVRATRGAANGAPTRQHWRARSPIVITGGGLDAPSDWEACAVSLSTAGTQVAIFRSPKGKPRRSGALTVHMHVGDTPRTLTTLNLGSGSIFAAEGMFGRTWSEGSGVGTYGRPPSLAF
jgi:hypothetical protein